MGKIRWVPLSVRAEYVRLTMFSITNMLAGTQIAQMGRGEKLIDASDKKQADSFQAKVGEFMKKMGADMKQGVVSAGYPIIHDL